MGIFKNIFGWFTKDTDPLAPLPNELVQDLARDIVGDAYTIEILNDDKTSMVYVMKVFETYIGLPKKQAITNKPFIFHLH